MKLFCSVFASALILFYSHSLYAQYKVLAQCSGFILPNGLALSFEFILDPQNTGRSKSEIHSYEQNSLILDAKLSSLGSARCESESIEITRFHCVTEFSQDYFFDIASGTALEKSDGFRAQFNCRFF